MSMSTEKIPTPRTDAESEMKSGIGELAWMSDFVSARFACQLERELAKANATNFDLRNTSHLLQELAEFKAQVRAMQECYGEMLARLNATPINMCRGFPPMCEGDFEKWNKAISAAMAAQH